MLTAGRPDPDPMSVLTSDRMRRVLDEAARSFDWVIIDTPPVGLLTDAHLLASLVDTVVLVVRAGIDAAPARCSGRSRRSAATASSASCSTARTEAARQLGYLRLRYGELAGTIARLIRDG